MHGGVLDGQLRLGVAGAPIPCGARVILERTPESHTFIVRSSGAFATLPFGERLSFGTGPGGEVTGYEVASGARFVRKPTLYASVERRRQPQAPYVSVERRKPPQVRYVGVERRVSGGDRRGQHPH